MMRFRLMGMPLMAIFFALAGCQSAGQHMADVQSGMTGQNLSVGTVQREIRIGMTGAEVAETLGSPNIVSTDEQRREVWIYDKIATDRAYSSSSGGVGALVLGIGTGVGGLGGLNVSGRAGASSTSQRTLTVIIKFGDDNRVRDFAYHQSKF
jgi:outer membrane protein assembly factor BamE (lipoprotein component of BamABCDE complex)